MQMGYAGIEPAERDTSYEFKNLPIKCPHCGKSNAWDAEVCGFCNFALTQKRQVGATEYLQRTDALEKGQKQMAELLNTLEERFLELRSELKKQKEKK